MKKHILVAISLLSFYCFQAQNKEIKPISNVGIASKTTKPQLNIGNKKQLADSIKPVRPEIVAMPKRGFAMDWLNPKSVDINKILTFSKIEVGVHFPDSLTKQVRAFVTNENTSKKINPFNPEEIDVFAELEYQEGATWSKVAKINGFYYQDFIRNTKSTNLEAWNWEQLNTDDYFRIRFTSTKPGKWRVTVIVKLNGKEVARMGAFEFNSRSSKNKGFLSVAKTKTHLTLGNETFIPIGQNMPKPTCFIEKDNAGKIINDPFKCANVPCAGIEDGCDQLKNVSLHPKVYMSYLEELNNLKKAGGNYFRMINVPFSFEIEYENLGNYAQRMHCAWELDQVVEKAEKLDLKMNFNLFGGSPLLKASNGSVNWDWYADNEADKGYCYRHELNLKEPVDFLTNNEAKKHFKNRIRYYIARYGYTTAIALIELMSEINAKFPAHPELIFEWHKEMANYIKEELQHSNQLLAVNYDGTGPNEEKGDFSFSLPAIDVMGHNIHRVGVFRSENMAVVNRYQKHQKPIIFSEIGTGNAGIETCDQHSEWFKDLWFSLFTGAASTGINWNLQHDYLTWNNFRNLKLFLATIDLARFQKTTSSIRKDQLVEMMARIDSSANKAFGVIQNTTWNYYTKGTDKNCLVNHVPSNELTKLLTVTSLNTKKGLKLNLRPKTSYKIEWINPFTAKAIDTITLVSTNKGMLLLTHPILNDELPFVAFKIYTPDEPFSKPINKAAIKTPETPIKTRTPKPIEIQEK